MISTEKLRRPVEQTCKAGPSDYFFSKQRSHSVGNQPGHTDNTNRASQALNRRQVGTHGDGCGHADAPAEAGQSPEQNRQGIWPLLPGERMER